MCPGPQPDDDDNAVSLYSPRLLQAIERARINNLEELNLSNMDLEVIPELIGNLTNLTSLNLSGAQIITDFLILQLSDYTESTGNLTAHFKFIVILH